MIHLFISSLNSNILFKKIFLAISQRVIDRIFSGTVIRLAFNLFFFMLLLVIIKLFFFVVARIGVMD